MSNPFSLLANEDGEAPSVGRSDKKAAAAGGKPSAAKKEKAPLSGFPGEQPAGKHAARVPDRQKDTHATEGGARGGRTSGRGGRGGRGGAVDTSVRQFDRRGAPTKHAPNHAHRDGAALGPQGGTEAVKQGDSAADVVPIESEEAAVPDMVIESVDPEDDGTVTYDEFLARKQKVDEDLALKRREVIIDESQFNPVKPLVREDAKEEEAETEEERAARRKPKTKKVLNLDEFRGGREADAKYGRPASSGFESRGGRGGRGGFEGRGGFAPRGGRGGFAPREGGAPAAEGAEAPAGAPRGGRGGRGGFEGRGGRGGRGGFEGRGGRGGFAPRGGRGGFGAPAAVPLASKADFPALGQ